MNNIIHVTKRNGTREVLDFDKINRVVLWGTEGTDACGSDIAVKARLQLYDGIPTSDIHKLLVRSAVELIDTDCPDYSIAAGRLQMLELRKEAYGTFEVPELLSIITAGVKRGWYDPILLDLYTEEEIKEIDSLMDHNLDLEYHYAGVDQLKSKYLVKDRENEINHESPQVLYILAAMACFAESDDRLEDIKGFYALFSDQRGSLPTPIMAGLRRVMKQFSSCVLIDVMDSIDGINAASNSIVKYITLRAGIGLNVGRIRATKSPIRGGEAESTGPFGFIKKFQEDVCCCSQTGVRKGSATFFFPWWHYNTPEILVLKNNRGTESDRARKVDYSMVINKFLLRRAFKREDVALFCPNEAKGLYDAFPLEDKFEELYIKYEADETIRRRTVPAMEILTSYLIERSGTGRVYGMEIDNVNQHGPFLPEFAPIHQSNLCLEIALPTVPQVSPESNEGEVALCTLAAFNMLKYDYDDPDSVAMLFDDAYIIAKTLDNILTYQEYPIAAAQTSTNKYRPLGVGITNKAAWMAKHGYKFGELEGNNALHRAFEVMSLALLTASNRLARSRGRFSGWDNTRWSKGQLPIDWYNKNVDELHGQDLVYPELWEKLRADVAEFGLRNATLMALMPSETSSQVVNGTNGIENPRSHVSIKKAGETISRQVVPEYNDFGKDIEIAWDISNKHYLAHVCIMQKFVCQTISANLNYDPKAYPDERVPMPTLIGDLVFGFKHGCKTVYYHNTRKEVNAG